MQPRCIKVDKKVLPHDEHAALELLFDYFSDFVLDIEEAKDHYLLQLVRSSFAYCEDLSRGLNWLRLRHKDIADFHVVGGKSFLCLLESWIPYGWSSFMACSLHLPRGLTVIHLDDHTDLMSPKICTSGGNWTDLFTGDAVDFSAPESIRNAVESGAITLGSMLTPLIHYLDRVDIIHIKQNSQRTKRSIEKTTRPDSIIDPTKERLCINLLEEPVNTPKSAGTYLATPSLANALQEIRAEDDLFLHVDMDFFNNRYDGSTSWEGEPVRHDPDLLAQTSAIKEFCQCLCSADLIHRIAHVSIGLSPSFYPAEYWEDGVLCLLNEFEAMNLEVSPEVARACSLPSRD